MVKKIKKAAIYCRTTDKLGTFEPEYEHDSIVYQIGSSFVYIIDHDLEFCGVYSGDDLISVWREIAEDYRNGLFDCLIVRDMNIISNSEEELQFICNSIPVLIIGSEDGYYTKEEFDPDTFEIGCRYHQTDDHKRNLHESLTCVVNRRSNEGKAVGRVPYGYVKNGVDLVADPTVADVVREIFQLAQQGKKPSEIKNALISSSRPTPGKSKSWSDNTVRNIISNQIYCGTAHIEAIISQTEFDKANAMIPKRKKRVKAENLDVELFPMIRCEVCGKKLIYRRANEKVGWKTAVYRCPNHTGENPTESLLDHAPQIDEPSLTQFVLNRCNDFVEKLNASLDNIGIIRAKIERERDALSIVKLQVGSIVQDLCVSYSEGEISEEEYSERVAKLYEDYCGIWKMHLNNIYESIGTTARAIFRQYSPIIFHPTHMETYDPSIGSNMIRSLRLKQDGSVSIHFFGEDLLDEDSE